MSDLIRRDETIKALKLLLDDVDPYDEGYNLGINTAILEIKHRIPTSKVKENTETKFYYVESIDDYWIGKDLGDDCTLYYAKWYGKLGFVWSASRYLPWGEHVVDPTSLWKEYTYPSEPKEIPFTDWITGFVKKYFKGE